MLSWRTRRQLIVFLIIAIPVAYFGYSTVLKFLPEPTCQDNRKNQGELAIDCGGPCAPCEIQNPKPVSLFWTRIVPVRENTYDVAAEIQNNNEVLSAKRMDYQFDVFSETGASIAVRKGSTFLFPQERMHVIEANIQTTREPGRVEFKILNIEWIFRQEAKPNIVVEKRDYKILEDNGSKKSTVEASIMNRMPFGFREIELQVVLTDKDENLLGAQRVIIDNVLGNSSQNIRVVWPKEIPESVASVIIEPRVNVFDPSIILKP